MKGLIGHLLYSKIRNFTKMQDDLERVSFKFSHIQFLVFKESVGNMLLQKGTS